MTETLLGLVPDYGLWLLGLCAFLAAMAVPLPSSVLVLAAGGFVASGDLAAGPVAAVVLGGAMAGDQVAYWTGRAGSGAVLRRAGSRAALLNRARDYLRARGGMAVFLSRWLVSALGPYVSFAAGMSGMAWGRFMAAGLPGMLIWIGIYLGLGYGFADNLEIASGYALKGLGLVAALAVAVLIGRRLLRG